MARILRRGPHNPGQGVYCVLGLVGAQTEEGESAEPQGGRCLLNTEVVSVFPGWGVDLCWIWGAHSLS